MTCGDGRTAQSTHGTQHVQAAGRRAGGRALLRQRDPSSCGSTGTVRVIMLIFKSGDWFQDLEDVAVPGPTLYAETAFKGRGLSLGTVHCVISDVVSSLSFPQRQPAIYVQFYILVAVKLRSSCIKTKRMSKGLSLSSLRWPHNDCCLSVHVPSTFARQSPHSLPTCFVAA
ncbi:hypothetical protein BV25DRAFT_575807 [Artomyces pyxidatus]|uniref:Uncharacterized protein n=1 Tax=Artomyces pyxidatus TaxID=48021 RepID=A0ACB8TIZ8_9AGAM|nr:hypothetical protein BV25DRAFT_575807 [Artomyces pyxidatus]